jgi:tetratricopeptide (TPR) repeat protein
LLVHLESPAKSEGGIPIELGQQLLHYRLIEKLGEGGMGVVYRATDTKLGRDVALKLLPVSVAAHAERFERFRREARAMASLNHPNIVTIHSVEETAEHRFLTMELIRGAPLDRLIPQDGLPVDQLYSLAIQLADALSAAHDNGIVHRDLKPGNVMVDETSVLKVLDFGLAKLDEAVSSAGTDTDTPTEMITREGVVMGTVPYMSPEQVSARPVDHRSDLFSLGIILYEMASGARPFTGNSSMELASAILRDPAPPLGGVPDALERLIANCLQKEPGDRIQSAERIAKELRTLQSVPAEPQPAAEAPARRPFVGRQAERETIREMLKAARSGRGGMVLLGGEPGVGKTRLAEELLTEGAAHGMLALEGHAYEDEGVPFVTALEIIEEMTRLLPAEKLRGMLGDNASEIARLMPELRRRFPDIPQPIELPPEQQRRYLFNSVLEFLERATRQTPMVMLLDDLHWADESSLLLLEHIAPQLEKLPLLFIGTYRDVELEVGRPFARMRAGLVRGRLARRIAIRRFGEDDVASLLSALGGPEPPPSLVTAIFNETEGNPFFVTEVFEHLTEEGSLFNADGSWRGDLNVEALEVPEGVRLVIGRRLERLDPKTPKVLALASIVGLRFDLTVIERASGDPDDVLDAIEEAEKARLVAPLSGRREPRYEFAHALVRQTLLNTMSVPRRQRGHLRIAEAMEQVWGTQSEAHAGDIAHHLYQSGAAAEPAKARRYLALAARRALEAAAADEALVLVERAFEFDEDIEDNERGRLHRLRGRAKRTLSDWAGWVADWEEALALLEAVGDREAVAELCRWLGYERLWANRIDEAKAFLRRGLDAVGEEPGPDHCRLLGLLGHAFGNGGDYDAAEEGNRRAIAMAESLGDEGLLSSVILGRLYQCEHWVLPRRQFEVGIRAIEVARRAATPWDLCSVMGAASFGILSGGGARLAEELLAELRPLALRLGHNGGELHCDYGEFMAQLWHGDLPAARRAAQAAIDRSHEMDMPWVSLMYAWAGDVELMSGDREQAFERYREAMDRRLPLTFSGCEQAHAMRAYARIGDPRAKEMLRELEPLRPRAGAQNPAGPCHVGLATIETAALLGEDDLAASLHSWTLQLIEQAGAVTVWSLGLAERYAGIAAAAGGRWQLAEKHFSGALRQAEELPHRLERPELLGWWGWMLRRKEPERAKRMLTEAKEAFAELGVVGEWGAFTDP